MDGSCKSHSETAAQLRSVAVNTKKFVTNQEKYGEPGQYSRVPTPSLSAYLCYIIINMCIDSMERK